MSYIKFIFFVCTVQMIILYVIKVYWMSQTGLRLCACVLLTHHHITEHTGCIGNGVPWLLIVMVKVFIMYDVIMLWHLFKLMEGPNALHNRIWVIRHAWCEKTDKWKLQRVCVEKYVLGYTFIYILHFILHYIDTFTTELKTCKSDQKNKPDNDVNSGIFFSTAILIAERCLVLFLLKHSATH